MPIKSNDTSMVEGRFATIPPVLLPSFSDRIVAKLIQIPPITKARNMRVMV